MMVYGLILAGGSGKRMGAEIPKQFLEIDNKPVIARTIEKFEMAEGIDRIMVLTPEQWIEYTENIIELYVEEKKPLAVVAGGRERNDTLMNAIRKIDEDGNLDEKTIIVTHDAVRPFVTERIIWENIEGVLKYGAVSTVIPAIDTVAVSEDGRIVDSVPDRSKLYNVQTPQSFRALEIKTLYDSLDEEERKILTDASKIMIMKGRGVHMVRGETYNIKITWPGDMITGEAFAKAGY